MRDVGSGDKLARGAHKASYLTTEKAISKKKWDAMFEDFDPETFEMPKVEPGAKETNKTGRR